MAKLADLGLTKRLNDDSQLTSIHQGVGTSYYMPYEQAVNANLVDGRSDVFALGASLYHLLTGEVPFAGTTHDEVVREKWQGTFRPVRALNPNVPKELAHLIEVTLACDPRERFRSRRLISRSRWPLRNWLLDCLPSRAFHSSERPEEQVSQDESPTRADHHIPLTPPTASESSPPMTPPPGGGFTGGTRQPGSLPPPAQFTPPRTRGPGWLWLAGVGLVAGTFLTGKMLWHRPTPPPAIVKDSQPPTSHQ